MTRQKIDKRSWKDIDIYYIGYVDKDKPSEWNVNSANLLYLIVNRIFCFVGELFCFVFCFVFVLFLSGIKYHIEKLSNEEVKLDSDYDKIKFVTDDSLPLGKLVYFPSLTVIIRCVFNKGEVYYPQVYLDDCLYQI